MQQPALPFLLHGKLREKVAQPNVPLMQNRGWWLPCTKWILFLKMQVLLGNYGQTSMRKQTTIALDSTSSESRRNVQSTSAAGAKRERTRVAGDTRSDRKHNAGPAAPQGRAGVVTTGGTTWTKGQPRATRAAQVFRRSGLTPTMSEPGVGKLHPMGGI